MRAGTLGCQMRAPGRSGGPCVNHVHLQIPDKAGQKPRVLPQIQNVAGLEVHRDDLAARLGDARQNLAARGRDDRPAARAGNRLGDLHDTAFGAALVHAGNDLKHGQGALAFRRRAVVAKLARNLLGDG